MNAHDVHAHEMHAHEMHARDIISSLSLRIHLFLVYLSNSSFHLAILCENGPSGPYGLPIHRAVGLLAGHW
jgi:hypothetical protein